MLWLDVMAENSTSKSPIMNNILHNITLVAKMEESVNVQMALLFTTAGAAFCLANSFLVLYFTHKKQFTLTTFTFLCNLGISDIVLGICVLLFGIMMFVPSQADEVGITIFSVGAACASTMSASCILLLSIQVSHQLQ